VTPCPSPRTGGYWLHAVAVTRSGALLVGGVGGIQRSSTGGRSFEAFPSPAPSLRTPPDRTFARTSCDHFTQARELSANNHRPNQQTAFHFSLFACGPRVLRTDPRGACAAHGARRGQLALALSTAEECSRLCAVGAVVYALVDGGLRKSEDDGLTWADLGRAPPHGVTASDLLCFTDETHGFVGNVASCLYFTADGGRSWEPRLSVVPPMRFCPRTLVGTGIVPA